MRNFLSGVSLITFLLGVSILINAKSSIHEIEAGVLFIISIIALGNAAFVDALIKIRHDLKQQQ